MVAKSCSGEAVEDIQLCSQDDLRVVRMDVRLGQWCISTDGIECAYTSGRMVKSSSSGEKISIRGGSSSAVRTYKTALPCGTGMSPFVTLDRVNLELALERVLQPVIEFVGLALVSIPEYPPKQWRRLDAWCESRQFMVSALAGRTWLFRLEPRLIELQRLRVLRHCTDFAFVEPG